MIFFFFALIMSVLFVLVTRWVFPKQVNIINIVKIAVFIVCVILMLFLALCGLAIHNE